MRAAGEDHQRRLHLRQGDEVAVVVHQERPMFQRQRRNQAVVRLADGEAGLAGAAKQERKQKPQAQSGEQGNGNGGKGKGKGKGKP